MMLHQRLTDQDLLLFKHSPNESSFYFMTAYDNSDMQCSHSHHLADIHDTCTVKMIILVIQTLLPFMLVENSPYVYVLLH